MSNHLLLPSIQSWNYPSLDIAENTASTTIVDHNLGLAFDPHISQQATDTHDVQLQVVVDRLEAQKTSGSSNMNAGEQNPDVGFSFDLLSPQPNALGPLNTEVTPAYFNEWMNPLDAHPIPGMLRDETDVPFVGARMTAQPFIDNEFTHDERHTFESATSLKNVPLNDNHTAQHNLSARFMRMISEANVDPYEFISFMLADRHLDENRLRKVFGNSQYGSRRDHASNAEGWKQNNGDAIRSQKYTFVTLAARRHTEHELQRVFEYVATHSESGGRYDGNL
ncbi:hypothetical protein R3P38DRAFT_2775546 [Favolaschia claudopus]|uniref:Uncharacterized protein n=1 Tax=Favolaschia claudopus TaxID=2862362 RepID=A0AAW0BTL1_9AGAR